MSFIKALNQRIVAPCCMFMKTHVHSKKFYFETNQDSNTKPPGPPSPDLCCMTGCENCVWIQHAEQLLKFYKDSGEAKEKVFELIEKEVKDESVKAYLKFEINMMIQDLS